MTVVHIEKSSFVNWDGKITAVLYIQGCNFRCSYCYNKELIHPTYPSISFSEIQKTLTPLKDWIDGVVITGGEPTLNEGYLKSLIDLIEFPVKLDTNGSKPATLRNIISLLDYIAMDVKWYFDRYEEITGVPVKGDDLMKSVEIIKNSGIDYEFRTTVLHTFTLDDIVAIADQVAPAKRYVLQPEYRNDRMVTDIELLKEAKDLLMRKFEIVKIRGLR
ncbi:MAG: anaerobic ribonucleoside-triphosphate reductase activating protein [Candidatus Thorarchaeota archaeon]